MPVITSLHPRSARARLRVRSRELGLSLIELMVAMVLGLLLLGAVLQVYLSTKMTFVTQDNKAALEETGRYAVEIIARDVRMAGLTGCSSRFMPGAALTVTNFLKDNNQYPFNFASAAGAFGPAMSGLEAKDTAPDAKVNLAASNPAPGGSWNAAPAAVIKTLAVPGSDILLFNGMAAQTWPLVDPYTSGAQIFVQAGNDFVDGDILFVTDCSQGFIFQATNVAKAGGSTNVVGAKGGKGEPGNADAISEQGPNGAAFREGAMVARANQIAYFIGKGSGDNPALYRASLLPPDAVAGAANRDLRVEELVTGVESMQLLYGVDSNGDFSIDQYQTADAISTANTWDNVRTVRIAMLARAEGNSLTSDDTQSYSLAGTLVKPVADRRQRRVFSMTISMRNRLP